VRKEKKGIDSIKTHCVSYKNHPQPNFGKIGELVKGFHA